VSTAPTWRTGTPGYDPRRSWPDPHATGEWVPEPFPGQRPPVAAPAGEITGEWPTGVWASRQAAEPARPTPAGWVAGSSAAGVPVAGVPRLLASVRPDGRAVSLADHRRAHGPLRAAGAFRLIAESGLRGRGGAGFPVEAKVRSVLAARGKAVVVVNGAAGDPLGEKDTFLVSRLPHLVLDGAQVAAEAVEARQVMVYVV